MDCRKALEEADGDFDRAVAVLQEQGIARAAKKATRVTQEGIVEPYVHSGGKIGSLVKLSCETDFVARTDEFKTLAHEVAMQVAATAPQSLDDLLEQPYIRDPSKTIKDLLVEVVAKLGENIKVDSFARFEVGL
ncbi:elongation factor Ts [Candidatus Parcubacteria bacterium]|nr:elongation factor Ts [Candidatus Parcubacteria bacterium]